MSRSIFASSRRIVSKASVLPHGVRCYLGSPSPARKISLHSAIFPKNTLENEPRPPNSELLASLYRPGDALNFNVGQQWSSNKVLEMWQSAEAIIGDYLEKYGGLDTLYVDALLWKFLTSDERFKDFGVFYRPAPVPGKNEWKDSWFEEGKPSWLGIICTRADYHLCYTAIVDGFINEEGKVGYAVILIDNYARPKVAAVGFSPEGSPFLFDLLGIRAALQLSLDTRSGASVRLTTRSQKVHELFSHISELEELDIIQRCKHTDRGDDGYACQACLGEHLSEYFITESEDFEVVYPVILEILELRTKLGCYGGISHNFSQASIYLGKCYGTPTSDQMKLFKLLDCEHGIYEMVLKPDKFPEKLANILYDDCFKGYRYYGQDILEESELGPSRILSASDIFKKIGQYRVLRGV